MKTTILLLLAAVLITTGCANKSQAKLREQEAFLKGQQQAFAAQQQAQQPAVFFRGLIRQGQTYPINIKTLLRGLDDPPLEPGDIVEVTR